MKITKLKIYARCIDNIFRLVKKRQETEYLNSIFEQKFALNFSCELIVNIVYRGFNIDVVKKKISEQNVLASQL